MLEISIIVPVYNAEQYLERCLKSIKNQTFTDFECIIVDDSSKDSSANIYNWFAKNDTRFKICKQNENRGVSAARQLGISKARGLYSIHIDSDDWIEPVMCEHVVKKIRSDNSDILFMDFFEENPSGKESYKSQNPSVMDAEAVLHSVLKERIFSCMWNIIVRQNLYENFKISFPHNINYGEDSTVVTELLLNNPKISYLPRAYYHHSFNHNSLTRRSTKEKYYERLKFLNGLQRLFQKYNRIDLDQNSINFFPLNAKYEMLSDGLLSRKEYQNMFKIKTNMSYLKNSGFRRFILLALAETKFYSFSKFFARTIRKIKYFM
jgi:glycosyltransferase involved in cell wall biosynthesis